MTRIPIHLLSDETVRLLGSPLVITTPDSLVKELLENAIDAKATRIEVLISPDTVENIEVRDNGTGIHAGDFEALGRRGHTSKLRSFEELRDLGGSTLGFRGEALAAANGLGHVSITTRTSDDPAASIIHLRPRGDGVARLESTSAPQGTSVVVTNLFYGLPVRKKAATKEAQTTIAKIKALLISHALARPQLRLHLKIPGTSRAPWSYAPLPSFTTRNAVAQLFGADLASQCAECIISHQSPHETADHFVIEAILPEPSAKASQISMGPFVFVDSRPVAASRGLAKKLQSLFRTHLARCLEGRESQGLKDLFMRLNIKCPAGSYDPNVEPSKGDVLFADEHVILNLFERLCVEMYASTNTNNRGEEPSSTTRSLTRTDNPLPEYDSVLPPLRMRDQGRPSDRTLAARDSRHINQGQRLDSPTWSTSSDAAVSGATPGDTPRPSSSSFTSPPDRQGPARGLSSIFRVDMSGPLGGESSDEDGHVAPRPQGPAVQLPDADDSAGELVDGVSSLNPWLIAKMNAPVRPAVPGQARPVVPGRAQRVIPVQPQRAVPGQARRVVPGQTASPFPAAIPGNPVPPPEDIDDSSDDRERPTQNRSSSTRRGVSRFLRARNRRLPIHSSSPLDDGTHWRRLQGPQFLSSTQAFPRRTEASKSRRTKGPTRRQAAGGSGETSSGIREADASVRAPASTSRMPAHSMENRSRPQPQPQERLESSSPMFVNSSPTGPASTMGGESRATTQLLSNHQHGRATRPAFEGRQVLREELTMHVSSTEISDLEEAMSGFDSYVLTGKSEEGLDKAAGTPDLRKIKDRLRKVLAAWLEQRAEGQEGVVVHEVEINLQPLMKGKAPAS